MIERTELAIIGGGPAGIEAAVTASAAGVTTVLLDSCPHPGGQYFKQLPAQFRGASMTDTQKKAAVLLDRLDDAAVQQILDTIVWGVFPDEASGEWILMLHGGGAPTRLQAKIIILASGAYDRPLPFPGWTLPGVMTAGAGQVLVKNQRVSPGKRVLVSGAGPLQFALAAQLVYAGVDVAAVLEGARPFLDVLPHIPALWGQWERMREGLEYARALLGAGIPYRFGWSVIEARGQASVEEAVIARLDRDWRPVPGTEQVLDVDTVVAGYGLVPNTAVSRMLACRHVYQPGLGGWVPWRDETLQTSLDGFYVIGDAAGIGGAELARLEGRLAGTVVARRNGSITQHEKRSVTTRLAPALARQRRFARFLGAVFTPRRGLFSLAAEDTILCRCEELTLGDIHRAVAEGARSLREVKMLTRSGMGNCQGRMCEAAVVQVLVEKLAGEGVTPESAGAYRFRPPLIPLPISVLAQVSDT